ncbi:MAG: 5-oxoprolinase subunit C family protein [Hyphococcus sp.]
MTAAARIVAPGAQTTIQDAGRSGARHLGVPRSGAADRISFALANVAAGNPWDAPALECALTGPGLDFLADAAFALGGADMQATLNGARIPLYTYQKVKAGDALHLGAAQVGLRAYIALAGGVAGAPFLGSVATYLPARLGGLDGRALAGGDVIHSGDAAGAPVSAPDDLIPHFTREWFLRATPGPEAPQFSSDALRRFFGSPFVADRRANRMGVRLSGGAVHTRAPFGMKSSAVFPGTVQQPPDGAPFLLLADAQTLGGYPRIAQVIDADLHLAGQIRPGDKVWFSRTGAVDAQRIGVQRAAQFASVIEGFGLC